MERDRNVYRLHSVPDLVLNLGRISTPQLHAIDGGLHDQQGRVVEDIAAVEAELEARQDPQLVLIEFPDNFPPTHTPPPAA